MTDDELVECARRAAEFAAAELSGYKVGAAILAADGRVFTGCNVESSSYGLTICAERTALVKALSEGAVILERIAVVTAGKKPAAPCGACRQMLYDYAPAIEVIFAASGDSFVKLPLLDLLPMPFGKEDLR